MSEGKLHDNVKVNIVLDRSGQSQGGMNEGYSLKGRNCIAKAGKVWQLTGTVRKGIFLFLTDIREQVPANGQTYMQDI
jgi:hypothetical protein